MAKPVVRSVQWSEVHAWILEIAATSGNFDSIVGVSRGGATPAICLSYIATETPLHFAYRDNAPAERKPFYVFGSGRDERLANNRSSYRITNGFRSRRPLVVDDVATFGDTLTVIGDLLASLGAAEVKYATYAADVATLQRERPSILSNLSYHESIDNAKVWLSFPWHAQGAT
ncbi:phosphoribosyltransferase family protein [Lentzea sp. BCCO 10_0061]|uniref:Phosphoribosyltransferase family protein n=1 Tax=Lentzea sokolovensis TaxID=3095429 RepID=A0ABU4VDW4_9PSEU|nr:phosphoribosyltransferase family protein [Lentzea sp. BCCO 10_0061]MDX8149894.1 phosphoribosyltransferase family protein [Lentzea sp. BCCO 10_0061]